MAWPRKGTHPPRHPHPGGALSAETPHELAIRVTLVGLKLDRHIADARARGYRIVRHAFEVPEQEGHAHGWVPVKPGVCALAAYNLSGAKESLGFSVANIDGEWDAFDAGWDGTPWVEAWREFGRTVFPVFLSPAFYGLDVIMAGKHKPEDATGE